MWKVSLQINPSLHMQTRKEGPTAMAESVLSSLDQQEENFENASPLDAGILIANGAMSYIVDLMVLQELEPHISCQFFMGARLKSYLYRHELENEY
jgi:hypothetical protein